MRASRLAVVAVGLLTGCAQYSFSTVDASSAQAPARAMKTPEAVQITEGDITDRPYRSLGDISVAVNKTTIFNADPTHADVDRELRAKAAALGADAVVLVRYGSLGLGLLSWGEMGGKGRAIIFD